jgi:carbonic anhydrase
MSAPTFTISELAKEFDLTTRAIRFYEDMGLLTPERAGLQRVYSARDRARLTLTLRAKRLGLSLTEAKDILDMYDSPRDTVPQLQKFLGVLGAHRAQLEAQMAELQANLAEVREHEKKGRATLARAQKAAKAAQAPDRHTTHRQSRPMSDNNLEDLFAHNRAWSAQMERDRPGFFTSLVKQQTPRYMWIGCSDSRVPANQITGLEPGEVFVHRNVANIVVHSDLNALSAIQFAVEHLKVEHIMVVGHYGCAGVKAALSGKRIGLADNWIRHIQDVRDRHSVMIESLPEEVRVDALCELNVAEQVVNVAVSTVMVDAWARGQKVHDPRLDLRRARRPPAGPGPERGRRQAAGCGVQGRGAAHPLQVEQAGGRAALPRAQAGADGTEGTAK